MAKGKYAEWLKPDKLELVKGWARSGLTDEQIAHNIGISKGRLYEWKKLYSDFNEALKQGKEVSDLIVVNSLYQSAIGRRETVKKPVKVKTVKVAGGKRIEEEHVVMVEGEVFIPPNITAQIFWLKNRMPQNWRERQVQEQKPEEDKVVIVDDY